MLACSTLGARSCRSCCFPPLPLVFFVILISSSSRRASARAASAPPEWGGDPGGKREGAASTYHQLKVEEGWHLPYQIFVTNMLHPSRSQAGHKVVLTIINNISTIPQPVLRLLRALLHIPQLDCYRNSARPKQGHRARAQLAANRTSIWRTRSSLSTHPSTANGGVSAFVRL